MSCLFRSEVYGPLKLKGKSHEIVLMSLVFFIRWWTVISTLKSDILIPFHTRIGSVLARSYTKTVTDDGFLFRLLNWRICKTYGLWFWLPQYKIYVGISCGGENAIIVCGSHPVCGFFYKASLIKGNEKAIKGRGGWEQFVLYVMISFPPPLSQDCLLVLYSMLHVVRNKYTYKCKTKYTVYSVYGSRWAL